MSTYNQYFAIEKSARGLGIPVNRDEIIAGLTGGRTHSLKDLSPHEYRELINYMNQMVLTQKTEDEIHCEKMRRKVIALLCKCGYVTKDNRPDIFRINSWCRDYGHGSKLLNEYTRQELPKLINQVDAMYLKQIDAL